MAKFSPGRNVGRLSIRVVPDTNQFRNDLIRRLKQIERTTSMTIRVDRANVNRDKIRDDIRRQTEGMRGIEVDANVKVVVDKAKLHKTKLRKSIQQEFDKFEDIRVKIAAEIRNKEGFEKEVRDMVDRASRNQARINVNAATLAASAQMRWVSRDRIVNLIVKVNQKSVVAAMTTLAALSGARLSWKWIDDLTEVMRDLDKNLPSIINWTTGITSLTAAIFAATSGLVGIGQGLFTILPAFLTLPGLLLNAVGSVTALIVALKNAGEELSPLKDDMSELGDIINEAFWGKARQPILNLVHGLMPQLRVAFRDLSLGIGEFTAAMSKAFGEELANGRLESIFHGIAEGWRVLGTGASGFAGALVSLSQIAATYTPRLAAWFVRQADTFDAWLKAIAEDGRLGRWMEDAIDSMYDLWDATTGLAGVFEGLYWAAEAAGTGGLKGFAELMQTWERTVKSADFQRGLTAVFKGAHVAMSAFGGAVRGIGRLVADLDQAFETFIGTAGLFLGGLIEGIADALNQPAVETGIFELSDGLIRALEGILPHLPSIAETFGSFLGLLGDLAANLLPTATAVLESLMPTVESLIDAIRPALPGLSDAVVSIVESLAPAIAVLADALGPTVIRAIELLADALVALAPLLDPMIRGLAEVVRMIGNLLAYLTNGIADLGSNAPDYADMLIAEKLKMEGIETDVELVADVNLIIKSLDMPESSAEAIQKGLLNPTRVGELNKAAQSLAREFLQEYRETLASDGQYAADSLVDGILASDLPQEVKDAIGRALNTADFEYDAFRDLGKTAATEVAEGLNDGKMSIDESMSMWYDTFVTEFEKSGLAGAQALWDSFNGYDQDHADMQKLLRTLQGMGIEIEDEMGDIGAGMSTEMLKQFNDHIAKNGLGTGKNSGALVGGGVLEGLSSALDYGVAGAGGGFSVAFMAKLNEAIARDFGTLESNTKENARRAGASTIGGLMAGIEGALPGLTAYTGGIGAAINESMSGAPDWLTDRGRQAMGGVRTGAVESRGGVISAFTALPSLVSGAMGGFLGSFTSIGRNMMGGVAAGIRAGRSAVSSAASGAIAEAVGAARRRAEIRSPSRLTAREIGKPLADGVRVGIERNSAGIAKSMSAAVDLSDVSGKSPEIAGGAGMSGGKHLHIHNPVVRDLMTEAWEAAQMAEVL